MTDGVQYHALRSRQSGARRFVSLHVLVPGEWTVHHGHQLLERIEADVRRAITNVTVFTTWSPSTTPRRGKTSRSIGARPAPAATARPPELTSPVDTGRLQATFRRVPCGLRNGPNLDACPGVGIQQEESP